MRKRQSYNKLLMGNWNIASLTGNAQELVEEARRHALTLLASLPLSVVTIRHSSLTMVGNSTAPALSQQSLPKLSKVCPRSAKFTHAQLQLCRSRTVRRRDVSAMVVANVLYEEKCVFEILQWLDYKGWLLDKCFCCHPEGQWPVWFPFRRKFGGS